MFRYNLGVLYGGYGGKPLVWDVDIIAGLGGNVRDEAGGWMVLDDIGCQNLTCCSYLDVLFFAGR